VGNDGFNRLCTAYATVFGIELLSGILASTWFDIKMEHYTAAFKLETSIRNTFKSDNTQETQSLVASTPKPTRSRSLSLPTNTVRGLLVDSKATQREGRVRSPAASVHGRRSIPGVREEESKQEEKLETKDEKVDRKRDVKDTKLDQKKEVKRVTVYEAEKRMAEASSENEGRQMAKEDLQISRDLEQAAIRSDRSKSGSYLTHPYHDHIGFIVGALISVWGFYTWKNPRNQVGN
ncbi:hypothetical protein AAMO2058_000883400, partial [Amorphochlora amoebiformis]